MTSSTDTLTMRVTSRTVYTSSASLPPSSSTLLVSLQLSRSEDWWDRKQTVIWWVILHYLLTDWTENRRLYGKLSYNNYSLIGQSADGCYMVSHLTLTTHWLDREQTVIWWVIWCYINYSLIGQRTDGYMVGHLTLATHWLDREQTVTWWFILIIRSLSFLLICELS